MFKEQRGDQHYPEREKLAAALECIGDGVICTNREGIIDFMNASAELITGWKAEEAYGEPFDKVLPILNIMTNKPMESPIRLALNVQRPVGLKNGSVVIARDGSQKYISANCSPIRNSRGNINGVVVVFRDITRIKQMENDVTRERNNFMSVIEATPLGMMIVGEDYAIKSINKALQKQLKVDYADIIGKPLGEGIRCSFSLEKGCGHGSLCGFCKVRSLVKKVASDGQPCNNVTIGHRLMIDDIDKLVWIKYNFVPLTIDDNTEVLIVAEDITEQKQDEEQLIRSKEYFSRILENFPTMIWKSDRDNLNNYLNGTWLNYTGFTIEETQGFGWLNALHPDDFERFKDVYTEAFDKRRTFEIEHRIKRYDGEYRWALTIGAPFYEKEGEFGGFVGTVLDITDRVNANKELITSNTKYESLIKNMNAGFVYFKTVLDEDGIPVDAIYIDVNNAFETMTRLKKEMLVGKKVSEILSTRGKDMEEILEGLFAMNKYGKVNKVSMYKFKDTECWCSVYAYSPEDGYVAVLVSDITEEHKVAEQMKKAKEAAEEANRAKSEFLANMSHEIRTPLNGVVGMIDLTMLSNMSDEQRDNLNTAKSCANSLLNIINDILDFSKMEAGKLTIEKVNFSITKLVEEVIKTHSVQAKKKGLELKYNFSTDIPQYLIGDPNRLKQVLNNLVNNAVKFTKWGKVELSIKELEQQDDFITLQFVVSDTGIGISKENMKKLFKSFSQVDGSFTKKFGGTGLGLVISKQLVEMMDGQMWVESESGVGSNFYFNMRFPIGKAGVKVIPVVSEEKISTSRLNILLVEDEIVNQRVTEKMLKEKGYTVDVAKDGFEAVELCKVNKYDIIFMDIQMPKMDGIQAAKLIREQETDEEHTPIVALTAFALQGDREKFISMGMDEYVSKPVKMEELYRIIEKLNVKDNSAKDNILLNISPEGKVIYGEKTAEVTKEQTDLIVFEISAEMAALKLAVEKGDILLIEEIAHKIKELSNRIDADDIKSKAFKIELAARRGNIEETMKYALKISCEFENYKKSLLIK